MVRAKCIAKKPRGLVDDNYGRMGPFWHRQNEKAYYRCRARERGYDRCGQTFITVDDLDEQVVDILSNLDIPKGFRERVESAVRGRVENEAALKRMEEINEIVERIDFRWDRGFISQEEYVEKREQLVREMQSLRPIDYDELVEAADLIENFRLYWNQCEQFDNSAEARRQLLAKMVERIFVDEGQVIAVVLHGDFGVVLGENETASAEITDAVKTSLASEGVSLSRSQIGSDGIRSIACIPVVVFVPRRVFENCLHYQPTQGREHGCIE